jgi:hypothetical protein
MGKKELRFKLDKGRFYRNLAKLAKLAYFSYAYTMLLAKFSKLAHFPKT